MRLREKTTATLLIAIFMISTMTFAVSAKPKNDYDTITEGEVLYSAGHYLAGQPIPTGFDPFGYNYQGHMFKGSYYNSYAGVAGYGPWTGDDEGYLEEFPAAENHWAWPHREIKLTMKWSDVWLSNMDRNNDGKLDRGYPTGSEPYTSSGAVGAWLTNHQFGSYIDDGKEYKWNYFVKIVCAPEDAYKETHDDVEYWYLSDGTEMGTVLWGAYARTLQIYNDQGTGEHGVEYNPAGPTGFGCYK